MLLSFSRSSFFSFRIVIVVVIVFFAAPSRATANIISIRSRIDSVDVHVSARCESSSDLSLDEFEFEGDLSNSKPPLSFDPRSDSIAASRSDYCVLDLSPLKTCIDLVSLLLFSLFSLSSFSYSLPIQTKIISSTRSSSVCTDDSFSSSSSPSSSSSHHHCWSFSFSFERSPCSTASKSAEKRSTLSASTISPLARVRRTPEQ